MWLDRTGGHKVLYVREKKLIILTPRFIVCILTWQIAAQFVRNPAIAAIRPEKRAQMLG